MSDDRYLWDRSGPADPEVARLERLLRGYAFRDAARRAPAPGLAPARPAPGAPRRRRPRRRFAIAAAAALALCVLGVRAWVEQRLQWTPGQPWQVLAQHGDVRIDAPGDAAVRGLLPASATLRTGDGAGARLRVAGIGELALGEGSRLRLEETRTGRHRVRLEQGALWARVWAPPGQFGVRIPGGDVLDLGCEFLLRVDEAGNGTLSVLSGWVQVDGLRREVLVPEGAQVPLRHGGAAGTPRAFGAGAAFVAALDAIDARGGAVDADGAEVRRLLAAARPEDAISLLTLLRQHPQLGEGPLFDRLATLLPATPAPTRDAWRADRGAVLNAWWNALPYPRVKRWWMQWPDALPARGGKMAAWVRSQGG